MSLSLSFSPFPGRLERRFVLLSVRQSTCSQNKYPVLLINATKLRVQLAMKVYDRGPDLVGEGFSEEVTLHLRSEEWVAITQGSQGNGRALQAEETAFFTQVVKERQMVLTRLV